MTEYIKKEDAIQALMGHFIPQTFCGEEVEQAKNLAESIIDSIPLENRLRWITVKWHEITDEEREREAYPEDWACLFDCEMPDDEQRILITKKSGFVEFDECYIDGEFSLDSGYDWIDDVIAWMPLPEPYKGE